LSERKPKEVKMSQYENALKIAIKAHQGQVRYDGCTPYIEHPLEIASQFDDDVEKSIAILHDVLEDCVCYDADILRELGVSEEVVSRVELITHYSNQKYSDYIKQVVTDPIVAKIKVVDMFCNLCDDPTDFSKDRYKKHIKSLISVV
jgi:(p)ppGpp synthase/HD superfamily hydrolase